MLSNITPMVALANMTSHTIPIRTPRSAATRTHHQETPWHVRRKTSYSPPLLKSRKQQTRHGRQNRCACAFPLCTKPHVTRSTVTAGAGTPVWFFRLKTRSASGSMHFCKASSQKATTTTRCPTTLFGCSWRFCARWSTTGRLSRSWCTTSQPIASVQGMSFFGRSGLATFLITIRRLMFSWCALQPDRPDPARFEPRLPCGAGARTFLSATSRR